MLLDKILMFLTGYYLRTPIYRLVVLVWSPVCPSAALKPPRLTGWLGINTDLHNFQTSIILWRDFQLKSLPFYSLPRFPFLICMLLTQCRLRLHITHTRALFQFPPNMSNLGHVGGEGFL